MGWQGACTVQLSKMTTLRHTRVVVVVVLKCNEYLNCCS